MGVAGLGIQELGHVCHGAEASSQAYKRCLGGGGRVDSRACSQRLGWGLRLWKQIHGLQSKSCWDRFQEMPKVKKVGISKRETIQPRV